MTADHVARAVELAEQAWDQRIDSHYGPPSRLETLALAQVHATLALAEAVGRSTVQRPRWDDDLRAHPPVCIAPRGDGILCTLDLGHEGDHAWPRGEVTWPRTPDHPEIVTERGQERPNGAGDVRAAVEGDR